MLTQISSAHWTLSTPDDMCNIGYEIDVIATKEGLKVGVDVITWAQLAEAKQEVV